MVHELIRAISAGLGAAFGDGYRIYGNSVTQGLREPCFFIEVLRVVRKSLPGGRQLRNYSFELRYFPENGGDNGEMLSVAERMADALEFITAEHGGLLRGTGLRHEKKEGVLHFYVNYNLHVIYSAERPVMDTITLEHRL